MKQTKKLTLSAIMVAMGVVFMALGVLTQVMELAIGAFASLIMVFVCLEIGKPYNFLVWLATTLLTFVFFPHSLTFVTYFLVFGFFPILKAYIERLPHALWILLKLLYINAVMVILIFVSEFITGAKLFSEGLELWLKILIYALCNIAFFVYDMFLVVMIRYYLFKLRPRFAKFLK